MRKAGLYLAPATYASLAGRIAPEDGREENMGPYRKFRLKGVTRAARDRTEKHPPGRPSPEPQAFTSSPHERGEARDFP